MSSRPNDTEATSSFGEPTGAEAATQPPIPPPTAPVLPSVPGYEILEELARGGMGVVYRARQLGFNRIVALKMILSGSHAGAEERARFRIEAEAVARLQHLNIVQVHEVGEHEGKPFFSMEFCSGGGLDKKLNATPLPPAEAARLVQTLARAVQAAHDKGVIHRDLKPANVLLTADGTPKVTDFGLAKRMDTAGRTQSGAFLGTASYAAPEQAAGKTKEMGPGTDVYALGAILYECLTGRPPFKAATALDTLTQVLSADPVPPRRLQPKTPRDLEAVALCCLEKDRARRYATAHDLALDLQNFLDGRPVKPRPVGAVRRVLRRTTRAVRRRPGVVLAVLASVSLSLLAGFFGPRLFVHESPIQPTTPAANPAPNHGTDEADPFPAPDAKLPLPPDLALVPPDAAGFVSVRVADLAAAPQFAELRRRIAKADPRADQLTDAGFAAVRVFLGLQPTEIERATVVFLGMPRPDQPYQAYLVIVATKTPYDAARRPLLPDVLKAFALHRVNDHLLLVGPSEEVLRPFTEPASAPPPRGPLTAALRFAAQPGVHAVIGLNVPAEFLKAMGERLDPKIRKEILPVTEMQSATVALTLAAPPDAGDRLELTIDGRLTFADAARAERGREAATAGLALLQTNLTQLNERLARGEMKPEDLARQLGWASPIGFASLQFLNPAIYALGTAEKRRQGDTVRVLLNVRTDAPVVDVNLLRYDPAWVKDATNRVASIQQLESIGKALKQYDAAHGRLPPAQLRSREGQPLLSWRVLLLPYLGQEELFRQFRPDEPWDGPHNRPLLDKMPSVYAGPEAPPGTSTTPYQVLAGKGTPFEEGQEVSLDKLGPPEESLPAWSWRPGRPSRGPSRRTRRIRRRDRCRSSAACSRSRGSAPCSRTAPPGSSALGWTTTSYAL